MDLSVSGAKRVIAVVLTMLRPRELEALLSRLEVQTAPLDLIVVVENTPHPETAEVTARHPSVRHVVSARNLGGAGGFAFGIYLALAEGASHVWLMDDDGLPSSAGSSDELLAAMELHGADLVSPVIVDIDDPARLAFPYFIGGRRVETLADVQKQTFIKGFAHLFNGVMIRAEAFVRFGVPDQRLFIRGDEVDYLHRVRRGGGITVTVTGTTFAHPSGRTETVPLVRGWLNAVMPTGDLKRYYFFRNRGYLVARHKLLKQAAVDLVRYPWYFLLVKRGDWRGLGQWLRWGIQGMREDFKPFEMPTPRSKDQGAP